MKRRYRSTPPRETVITTHAIEKWQRLCVFLGFNSSPATLMRIFKKAVTEQPRDRGTQFQLLKRRILRGEHTTFTADGWRFVITAGKCVTIERINPHENVTQGTQPALCPGEAPPKANPAPRKRS